MSGKTAKKMRQIVRRYKNQIVKEIIKEIKGYKFFDRLRIALSIVRGKNEKT